MSYEIYKVFKYQDVPRGIADKIIHEDAANGSYQEYTLLGTKSEEQEYFLSQGIVIGETVIILISW